MKRVMLIGMILASVLLMYNSALAYPLLQLDIINGSASYDPSDETIVTSDPTFDVVALLNPDNGEFKKVNYSLTDYILLASWDNATGDSFTLGSNTVTLNETAAPSNPQLNHGELGSYAYQLYFDFDSSNTATAYDTQTNPGGFSADSDFYYATFAVDLTGLDPFVPIHFDLFRYTGGNPEKVFAPFSHDASAVPEPSAMLLLGFGLIGLGAIGRRRIRRSGKR